MRLGNKRQIIIALTALAVLGISAAGYAHHRGRPWWLRPPAAPITNGTTFAGEAEDGAVRTVVVTTAGSTCSRVDLGDGTFTAAVAADALAIDSISLASADGNTRVTVTLPAAPLAPNYFNSTFAAQGTALIELLDPADSMTVLSTTTVNVFVFGVIAQKNGEYKLRAYVRGLNSVDDLAGTVTHTLLKLELEAETPVPTVP